MCCQHGLVRRKSEILLLPRTIKRQQFGDFYLDGYTLRSMLCRWTLISYHYSLQLFKGTAWCGMLCVCLIPIPIRTAMSRPHTTLTLQTYTSTSYHLVTSCPNRQNRPVQRARRVSWVYTLNHSIYQRSRRRMTPPLRQQTVPVVQAMFKLRPWWTQRWHSGSPLARSWERYWCWCR